MSVPLVKSEGLSFMMTHSVLSNTLTPDQLEVIQATAEVWRSRGYGQTADNLLLVAGLTPPAPKPSRLPPNVFRLSDYRPRAQAVSR